MAFTRFFTTDIGDDKSEKLQEPGITMLFASGIHLSSTLPIKLFHVADALCKKFCLVSSVLHLGISIIWLVDL